MGSWPLACGWWGRSGSLEMQSFWLHSPVPWQPYWGYCGRHTASLTRQLVPQLSPAYFTPTKRSLVLFSWWIEAPWSQGGWPLCQPDFTWLEASHGVSVPLDQMLNFPRLPSKLGGHMAQVLTWELHGKVGQGLWREIFSLVKRQSLVQASGLGTQWADRIPEPWQLACSQRGDTLEDGETSTLTLIEQMEGKLGSTMTDLKAFHPQTF